jgi:hypothetical protein
LATRKKPEVSGAEALLTTTAQMIGSALGKIAVKTGIESPPQAAPARKKAVVKKKVSSTRKKAASKKPVSSPASRAKSAAKAKK